MKTILLSFKAEVFERIVSGEKIFEHRRVFPDGPIKAYLYVSKPVKAICGVVLLNNKTLLSDWKCKYNYDREAVKRIDKYLENYHYVMEISEFHRTNSIPLSTLRIDLDKFVVPQMYYYIDDLQLLRYLDDNLVFDGYSIFNSFEEINSHQICLN